MHHRSDRLRAFCSITIDNDFVVHDLRVIEGRKGLFVAMPSRKLSDNCPRCGAKNELRAKYCGECGGGLDESRAEKIVGGRDKLHVDVAHPINTPCREQLQAAVLAAYGEEESREREGLGPSHDYSPEGLDELAEDYAESGHEEPAEASPAFDVSPEELAPAEREFESELASPPVEESPAESAEAPSAERPALTDEEPPPEEEKPDVGGFGEGIF
jgi:stage V sporulation protein G